MKTPFLVIRFILFALLGYHSVLSIAFSAWNIAAAKAAGVFVPSGPILLLFNSCIFFLWMALAVVEYVGQRANALASVVVYECVWAGIVSVLDLSAAIAVSLGGPPVFCQKNAPYALCASSTVLVPVSWFAGITAFSYFLTVLGLGVSHMRSQPGLWQRSIYDIPWFDSDRVSRDPPRLPPVNRHESTRFSFLNRRHSISGIPGDAEHASTTAADAHMFDNDKPLSQDPPPLSQRTDANDPNRPWWSRYRTRPGIDLPFVVRFSSIGTRNAPRNTRPPGPERDVEADASTKIFGDFTQKYVSFYTSERRPTQQVPESVRPFDLDRPLPRPPRSEWVRADGSPAPTRRKYGAPF